MPTIPIFVSSPFRDFHAERDVLAGPVREALDAALRPLGARVDLIDLRWGVDTSEDDDEDAAQQRILDVCLAEVGRARPFFLGLLGERYGTIPDPAHARWLAQQVGMMSGHDVAGLSVSALEFGHGFLWMPPAPTGCAVVLGREAVAGAPVEWSDRDQTLITALKAEVDRSARDRRDVVYRRYTARYSRDTSSADLGRVRSGDRLLSFADLVTESLMPALIDHARALAQTSDERAARRAFRDSHPVLVGRVQFAADIAERISGDSPVSLGVLGGWGSGKSALAVGVEKALLQRGRPVVSVFVGIDHQSTTMQRVVIELIAAVNALAPQVPAHPLPTEREAAHRWLRGYLTAVATEIGGLSIVVDGLNRVSSDRDVVTLGWLEGIPAQVGVLVTTESQEQTERLTASGFGFYSLGPLFAHEAAEAAQEWSRRSGRSLPAEVLTAVGSEARHPVWVRLAVNTLSTVRAEDFAGFAGATDQARAIREHLSERAAALPSGVGELLDVRFAELANRVGADAAEQVLGLLGASYAPLSVADLRELLEATVPDVGLVASTARNMLDDQVWEATREGGLNPVHLAYKNAWTGRATPRTYTAIARRAISTGVSSDVERLNLLVAVAKSEPGSIPSAGVVMASLLNALPPVDAASALLALTVAPQSRVLEVLRAMDPRELDSTGWAALDRIADLDLSDAWVDNDLEIPRKLRAQLARAVRQMRAGTSPRPARSRWWAPRR